MMRKEILCIDKPKLWCSNRTYLQCRKLPASRWSFWIILNFKHRLASIESLIFFLFWDTFLVKMDIFEVSVCSQDYHWVSAKVWMWEKNVWIYQVLTLDILYANPGWIRYSGNWFELWCSKVGHWWSHWRVGLYDVMERKCISV